MTKVKNPVLRGFYPDPSICRVENDFYLVNSSFAYFPGVPIFHSRDLAHWEQLGNVLDRPSQLLLEGDEISRGIFAPTLRFHEDTFYLITTNIDQGGNFVVKADTPKGPWSEPYYLGPQAQGIDPSLFFDEDGTCYYVGTRPNQNGVKHNGDWEIWIQELDLKQMKLVGESRRIWKGFARHVIWPEGPHLYKKDGYYYLIYAEGGTGYEHSVMAARSKSLQKDFEGCPRNPVLTHRHLGKNYPITCAGHGDLFDDENGEWYMVMLASRTLCGGSSLGRETFLAKVDWEDGWPVISPGKGILENQLEIPLEECRFPKEMGEDVLFHFWGGELDQRLLGVCQRSEENYSLKARKGYLRIYASKTQAKDCAAFSYLGVRQCSYSMYVSTQMEFELEAEGDAAGLLLFQNQKNHLKMEVIKKGKTFLFCVTQVVQGKEEVLAEKQIEKKRLEIHLKTENQKAGIFLDQGKGRVSVAEGISLEYYTTEASGGFVGCTVGLYASSYGKESSSWADFLWFYAAGR